jgi:multimeric flavodoxin WrbA
MFILLLLFPTNARNLAAYLKYFLERLCFCFVNFLRNRFLLDLTNIMKIKTPSTVVFRTTIFLRTHKK